MERKHIPGHTESNHVNSNYSGSDKPVYISHIVDLFKCNLLCSSCGVFAPDMYCITICYMESEFKYI